MLTLATTMQRIVGAGSRAFIPFLTAGFPDRPRFTALLHAARHADFIEVGLPFSDPVADGPSICAASDAARQAGMNSARLFEVLGESRGLPPLILMTYLNPVLAFGVSRFMREAARVGVRGIILTDLPPEDGTEVFAAAEAQDIASVLLVSPTTTDERIARICARASGFVYCIAVTGTTGARQRLGQQAQRTVQRVRALSRVPVVVGFGISTPRHAARVCRFADGAVVGSALIDFVREHAASPTLPGQFEEHLQGFIDATHAS